MTADEKKEIKQAVLDEIKAESNDITEIETVYTLDGLTGLPAMQGEKLVTAPLSLLSKHANNVVEFSGIVSGVTPQHVASDKYSFDVNCRVVYSKDNNAFILRYGQTYYNNWADGDFFGEPSANGRVPRKGKIYIDVTANKTYRWGGNTLKPIGGATVQKGAKGTIENYIYSTNDRESTHTVLSGKIWMYTHTDRNLFLRFKNWGAENDTNTTNYNQVLLCYLVNKNRDGLMDKYVFARILNNNLAEGLSTTDKVIVNYTNFAESGNRQLELTKATSAKAGVMTAEDKTKLDGFGQWLTTHNNVTTLDALNQELNAFDAKTTQGLHQLKCWGIPLLVTFAILNVDDNVFMQTIYGSLTVESDGSGIASIDSIGQHAIFVRYFNGTKWQAWQPLQPQKQTSCAGNSGNYVFSEGTDDSTRTILSSKLWIYQHSDRNQFLRFKHWGATNDTNETDYSQVMLPNAWTGGNGLLRYDIYKRIDNFELREQNSTATEVKIITPIFTTGGTRELSISQATTAKAGVMTAADKTKLNILSSDGAKAANVLYNAIGKVRLFGPGNINIFDTNNGTLGGKVPKTIYDSSTPTEYTKGSPFQVFCTQGIKSDINSTRYMVWFGLRKSATLIERYSSKQVIGLTEDELYSYYGNSVAFCLSDGHVYYPHKGASGLEIDEDTSYLLSDDTPYIMTFADRKLLYQIKQKLNL